MSLFRSVLQVVGRLVGEPAEPPRREPKSDGERLAMAVLDGDEEAALALADLVLMTYQRTAGVPEGLRFDDVAWPYRAKAAFRRMGVKSFRQLLGVSAAELLVQPGVGQGTVRQVRAILAHYRLALKGE